MSCKYGSWNRGQDEALLNILGGQEIAEKIIARKVKVTIQEIEETLLELVSTIKISATTDRFVARDKFVVNTGRNASVKISAVWDNFTEWFLSGDGKTEDPIQEQTLRRMKLRKSSVDGSIIAELGGEAKAETTLSEMFSLMEKQPNGEDGDLFTNSYANIFYIKDSSGVLRAVGVGWHDDGWSVYASEVSGPHGWRGGHRVFSRNPLES